MTSSGGLARSFWKLPNYLISGLHSQLCPILALSGILDKRLKFLPLKARTVKRSINRRHPESLELIANKKN